MNYLNKTREELIIICKEKNINGYSKKKKEDIIKLLLDNSNISSNISINTDIVQEQEKIYRLNYIGSKFNCLLDENKKNKTVDGLTISQPMYMTAHKNGLYLFLCKDIVSDISEFIKKNK